MEGDLSARIPVRGTQDEIDQLIASLNAMLGRIQQLMDGCARCRATSPTTCARRSAGCASTWKTRERAKTTADYDAATDAAIAEADELLETFSALLRIAQVEAGAQKSAFAELDLSALARSIGEAYQPAAEDSGHALDIKIEDGVPSPAIASSWRR